MNPYVQYSTVPKNRTYKPSHICVYFFLFSQITVKTFNWDDIKEWTITVDDTDAYIYYSVAFITTEWFSAVELVVSPDTPGATSVTYRQAEGEWDYGSSTAVLKDGEPYDISNFPVVIPHHSAAVEFHAGWDSNDDNSVVAVTLTYTSKVPVPEASASNVTIALDAASTKTISYTFAETLFSTPANTGSLSYQLRYTDGRANATTLPDWMVLDATSRTLKITSPPAGDHEFEWVATNGIPLSTAIPVYITLLDVGQPDDTSTLSCGTTLQKLTSTNDTFDAATCSVIPRSSGTIIYARISEIVASLVSGLGTLGAVAVPSTAMSTEFGKAFTFQYTPARAGGRSSVGVRVGAAKTELPAINFTSYAVPDDSSKFFCDNTIDMKGTIIKCTVTPQVSYSLALIENEPSFELDIEAVGVASNWGEFADGLYSDDVTAESDGTFTFQYKLGDKSGRFKINALFQYNPKPVTVSLYAIDTAVSSAMQASCERSKVHQGGTISCSMAMFKNNGHATLSYSTLANFKILPEDAGVVVTGPVGHAWSTFGPTIKKGDVSVAEVFSCEFTVDAAADFDKFQIMFGVDGVYPDEDSGRDDYTNEVEVHPAPDHTSTITCNQTWAYASDYDWESGTVARCTIVAKVAGMVTQVLLGSFSYDVVSDTEYDAYIIGFTTSADTGESHDHEMSDTTFYLDFLFGQLPGKVTIELGEGLPTIDMYTLTYADSESEIKCQTGHVYVNQRQTCTFETKRDVHGTIIDVYSKIDQYTIVPISAADINLEDYLYSGTNNLYTVPTLRQSSFKNVVLHRKGDLTKTSDVVDDEFEITFTTSPHSGPAYVIVTATGNDGMEQYFYSSITIVDNPDSTSTFACVSTGAVVDIAMTCQIIPRKAGAVITAKYEDFNLITTAGSASIKGPVHDKMIATAFTVEITTHTVFEEVVITDMTGMLSPVTLTSEPASQVFSWGQDVPDSVNDMTSLTFDANKIGPSIEEDAASDVTSSSGLDADVIVDMSCSNDICVSVSASGQLYTWGSSDEKIAWGTLGRKGSSRPAPVTYLADYTFTQVFTLDVYTNYYKDWRSFQDDLAMTVALTEDGKLYKWPPSVEHNVCHSGCTESDFTVLYVSNDPDDSAVIHVDSKVTLINDKGNIFMFATEGGEVYTVGFGWDVPPLGRASYQVQWDEDPEPAVINLPSDAAPIVAMLGQNNYGIVVAAGGRDIYSWGSALGHTILSSGANPGKLAPDPSRFGGELLSTMEGGIATLIAVTVTGKVYSMLLLPHADMDFDIGGTTADFELVPEIASYTASMVSVGYSGVYVATRSGAIFQWSDYHSKSYTDYYGGYYYRRRLEGGEPGNVGPGAGDAGEDSVSTELSDEPALLNIKSGSDTTFLYSNYYTTLTASPANPEIWPGLTETGCGVSTHKCATLSEAAQYYDLPGTVFILMPGILHDSDITIEANDIKILSKAAYDGDYASASPDLNTLTQTTLDCGGKKCLALKGTNVYLEGWTLSNGGEDTSPGCVQCGGSTRIESGKAWIISHMAFTGGKATKGGALLIDTSAEAFISNSFFVNNSAVDGGAIYSLQQSVTELRNTQFVRNSADMSGGAMNIYESQVQLLDGTGFDSNQADSGGAVFGETATLTVGNGGGVNHFKDNVASGSGGAIYLSKSKGNLKDTQFKSNSADTGGCIFLAFSELEATGVRLEGGQATTDGGGVYCLGMQTVVFESATFANNTASKGGAFLSTYCEPSFTNTMFTENKAVHFGGAIYLGEGAALVLTHSTFRQNEATRGSGGGVCSINSAGMVANNCSFTRNEAHQEGGALLSSGHADIALQGCRLNDNLAASGGAIHWNNREPIFTLGTTDANMTANNTASHGPFMGTSARQLVWSQLPGSSMAYSNEEITETMAVRLLDHYNQTITVNSFSSIAVESDNANVRGTVSGKLDEGGYVFDVDRGNVFALTSSPNSTARVRVSTLVQGVTYYTPYHEFTLQYCQAGFYDTGVECDKCALGKYSDRDSVSECSLCEPGKHQDKVGMSYCQNCSVGFITAIEGQVSCVECEEGKYTDTLGSDECSQCDPGSFNILTGKSACVDCPVGTYSALSGIAQLCPSCPMGRFSNTTGTIECEECAVGKFSSRGQSVCSDCQRGAFSSTEGEDSCVSCPMGKAGNFTGMSECQDCLKGTYTPSKGEYECGDCPAGRFSDSNSASSCTACITGRYTSTAGLTECAECPGGRYAGTEAATECLECEVGKYTLSTSACVDCAAGKFSNTTMTAKCTDCSPGKIQFTVGQTTCDECGVGTYAAFNGLTTCSSCVGVWFQSEVGRTACLECPPNALAVGNETLPNSKIMCMCDVEHYAVDVLDSRYGVDFRCDDCPDGANCDEVGAEKVSVAAFKGYFAGIDGSNEMFFECLNDACLGAGQCADNYQGATCTECADNAGRTSTNICALCPDATVNTIKLVGVVSAMLIFCSVFVWHSIRTAMEEKTAMQSLVQIFTSMLQFNAVAVTFEMDWPSIALTLLEAEERVGNFASELISFDCFLEDRTSALSPFYIKTIGFAAMPVLVCVIPCIVFFVYYLHKVRNGTNESEARQHMINLWTTTVVVIMFLIHPSVTQQTFYLFSCKKIGARSDDYYLYADLSEQCWTPTHLTFCFMLGLPMFIVYAIGIPLAGVYFVHRNKDALREERVRRKYAFLYKSFRPECYWWSGVVAARKIGILIVASFFSTNAHVQALLTILVIVMAMMMEIRFLPFKKFVAQRLELMSLVTSFVTFYCGQFGFVQNLSPFVSNVAAGAILAFNFLFLFGCVWFLTMIWADAREEVKKKIAKVKSLKNSILGDNEAQVGASDDLDDGSSDGGGEGQKYLMEPGVSEEKEEQEMRTLVRHDTWITQGSGAAKRDDNAAKGSDTMTLNTASTLV